MIRSALVLAFAAPLLALSQTSATVAAADGTSVVRSVAMDLDSARAEMAVGRYWHAARHLRELRDGGMEFGPAETLLLARADAGWRNWDAVAEGLSGRPWLAAEEGGLGLRLLGRALEAREDWMGAADAYARYLAAPHGRAAADRAAIQARRARVLARAGRSAEALAAVDSVAVRSPVVASWQALELAEGAASAGDSALVRRLVARISDGTARDRAWRLGAASILAAGDTARATALFETLAAGAGTAARRGVAFRVLGDLALARRDTAAAVERYRSALDLAPDTGAGVAAARALVDLDRLDPARALAAARTLDRAGADRQALAAYDLHVSSTGAPAEEVVLARARLMADRPDRQEEAVRVFRALSTSDDPDVGAGALESWADLRRAQGRRDDVETLRRWLVERYPASPEAVEYVFLRGDAAHDRQELERALEDYGRLQEVAPSMSRSGLARMRMAQIHLTRGDSARAVDVFRGYLADFPDGRRWDEASYWAGRILQKRGDPEGESLLRDVLEREPLSYSAVLAAEALGVPWAPPGGPGGGTPAMPDWMAGELALVDLLATADLEAGRSSRTAALSERAVETALPAALRLARELIARGHGLDGINLGWELRRQGMPWSRALLEVTYPFPHREMVTQAARARGLDPLLVASIIRQESAFDPDIRSSAGAIGLMQIMPETGRQLAREVGPGDFGEESLETPEINLHLGTRYVVELLDRFDGSLPLVLSAYNAGPHRADTWLSFPEAEDELRFTERIPYGETREYVKLITRNMALYRALYGDRPAS